MIHLSDGFDPVADAQVHDDPGDEIAHEQGPDDAPNVVYAVGYPQHVVTKQGRFIKFSL